MSPLHCPATVIATPSSAMPFLPAPPVPLAVQAPQSLDTVANIMIRHALITAESPELRVLSRRSVRVVQDVIALRPNAQLRFAYFAKLTFGGSRNGRCLRLLPLMMSS
jgi:hypothetical protein